MHTGVILAQWLTVKTIGRTTPINAYTTSAAQFRG